MRNIAVLLFDGVELLDFAGPFEVFSVADTTQQELNVYTVAEKTDPIMAANGLGVIPAYSIHDCPKPDIIVIPGGKGTREEMFNRVLTDWIKERSTHAEYVLSVCTGALLLAKAGLLEGLRVTTHHQAFEALAAVLPPSAEIVKNVRYVDNGKILLAAGISAGIDMSLHMVSRLLGTERAIATADRMEYEWKRA